MKKLLCHTNLNLNNYMVGAIKGNVYEIIDENDDVYEIIDETDGSHTFTKEPDEDGLSYKTWFTLIDNEGQEVEKKTTVFLLVHGDGDYGAMHFEDNYTPELVYQEMVEAGVTEDELTIDVGFGEESIYVEIHEFNDVDQEFIDFIIDEFLDYNHLKAKNFFQVK